MSGFSIDDLLKSSLSVLIFFALCFVGLWVFARRHVSPLFFVGFGGGALYLLWVNAKNNEPDKLFTGDINQLNAGSGGVITMGPQSVRDEIAAYVNR